MGKRDRFVGWGIIGSEERKKLANKEKSEDPKFDRNDSTKIEVCEGCKAGSNLAFFETKNYILS